MLTRNLFLALGCACAALSAQSRDARSITGTYGAAITVRLAKDDTQIIIDRHVDGSRSLVSVPIRRPGQLVLLDPLGDGLIVTGSDGAGKGQVCLLRHSSSSGAYALADTFSAAGSDFVGVGYAAGTQRLYLLDSGKGKVLQAPFGGGTTLPVAWNELVTSATEPALTQLDAREIVVDETTLPTPSLRLIIKEPTDDTTDLEDTIIVEDRPAGPVVRVEPSASGRIALIAYGPLLAGQTSIPVEGPANTLVSILKVDTPSGVPAVLGSAITDATGKGSVPVPAVQLGGVYAAQTSSWPWVYETSHVRFPELRIGVPLTLPDGVAVRPRAFAASMEVDNQYFGFAAELEQPRAAPLPVPRSYDDVVFVLGTSASQIGSSNGKPVLLGDLFLPTTGKMSSTVESGAAFVDVPIPNDPNLAGTVLLHQWVFTVGGTTGVTEITGASIRPFPWVSLDEPLAPATSPYKGAQYISSHVQKAQASRPTRAQRSAACRALLDNLVRKHGLRRFTAAERKRIFARLR